MTDRIRIVFLHHSTGGNLVHQGRARERFRELDPRIEFWDHGYDPSGLRAMWGIRTLRASPYYGLRDGQGRLQSSTWHIPHNNTDPHGLAELFQQRVSTPPDNALSHLLQFDVVVFKSCYPVTAIADETQLEGYKEHYLTIRETIDRYPQTLFIPMTPPPLRASLTTVAQAERARRFADWMQSDAFAGGRGNIAVYDFFDTLAASKDDPAFANTLQPRWCLPDPSDSHPNRAANEGVVGAWVNFIATTVQNAGLRKAILA